VSEKYGGISRVYQSGITICMRILNASVRQRSARAGRGRGRPAAAEEAQARALRQLLAARVSYLKRKGSTDTAKDEESNVPAACPEELKDRKRLSSATPEFKPVIAKTRGGGTRPCAAKLRLPCGQPINWPLISGTDPDVPDEFGAFGITVNPVASVQRTLSRKVQQGR